MSEPRPPTTGRSRAGFAAGALVGAVAALIVAAVAAWLLGDEQLTAREQAREVIESNYFEPIDAERLDQASIEGMVRELRRRHDDRFSHYFAPDELDEFNAATSGEFSGVGLTVSEVKRGLRVATVLPDTPAEEAGIEEGDVITTVDGRSIAGKPAQFSTGLIKGPPGTPVTLRVHPAGGDGPREVEVERAKVRVPAVEGGIRRTPEGRRVAYVRFATFSDGAHGELRDTIERLYRRGAEGLVLDLRGNGGGLLNEAVLSASVFVEDGTVVSTESRAQGDREYEAVGDALEPRPTVVLVNRDSASAAEILAAALQDNDLAEVVGTRSFGKGVFQEVIHLPQGGALDLTVGEYFTADGTSLTGEGVKPDRRAADDPETAPDEGLDAGLAEIDALLDESR